MSRLQEKAKPILLPLVKGENFGFALSQAEAKLLAMWATMFTMVVEFADPKTVAITPDERKQFHVSQETKEHWSIWIGRGPIRDDEKPWNFMHYGWRLTQEPPISETMPGDCNAQSSTFIVGEIFFLAYSSTIPILTFDANDIGSAAGIRPLWPVPSPIFDFGIRRLDGYDIHDLSRIFILKMDPEYPEPFGWLGRPKS